MKATKTQYEVTGFCKSAEVDEYETGCTGERQNSYDKSLMSIVWTDTSMAGLLEKLASFCGGNIDDVQIDPCEDDTNRVEFQVMETDTGLSPLDSQMEMWKAGKFRLWLCTYTFYVENVTREATDVKSVLDAEKKKEV